MPANVEFFKNIVNPAPRVYWDTSYIIRLKLFPTHHSEPDYKCCKDFYDLQVKNKVLFFTSIVAIQEAFHLGLFEWGIKQEMRRFTDSSGKPYQDIKKFKKEKPAEFSISYQNNIPKVYEMWTFINRIGLRLIYPKAFVTNPSFSISRRISHYASILLCKYKLETNDAFHIAIARCSRIDCIVTCDEGFKQVDKITVYSPK